MPHARHAPWLLVPCLALFAFLALPWPHADARSRPGEEGPPAPSGGPRAAVAANPGAAVTLASDAAGAVALPSPTSAAAFGKVRPPALEVGALGPMTFDAGSGRYVARSGRGRAELSIVPSLQQSLEKALATYRVRMGAVVLIEPRTGRVLALAEHVESGAPTPVALAPVAPAASIFKIVTSAALLQRGIGPDEEVCFHGGRHRIQPALLRDDPRRDRRCLTLADALGKSANVVFAKMAGRELSSGLLREAAGRFLFNAPIPFDWPVAPSTASISDEPFELATTAAGFGPVRMSPLHGALIAAIVANGGRFVPPRVVDAIDGEPVRAPAGGRQVIRPEVASALAEMMETTTTEGTARKWFRKARLARSSPLRGVSVAGKTGSLAEVSPYRDHSWFVGFAPVEDPQVAVAVVMVNDRLWHARASRVAYEALQAFFASERRVARTAQR